MTIDCILVAVAKRPRWSKLLVTGNFNADITGPEGSDQDEEIAAGISAAGLEDILEDFCTCLCTWNQDKGMCSMFGMMREVRSCTYYILKTYRCLFRNVSILDSRNNSGNYLILG